MMKKIICILAFFVASGIYSQNEVLFSKATEAYNSADYEKAISLYEKIVANDKHSAELYFNLGNAYYKKDEVGPSIYYYEKALLLKPNDSEILNNLGYAQKARLDAIDTLPISTMQSLYNTTVSKLTHDQWAYVSIGMIILFVLAYIAYYILSIAIQKRISFLVSITALLFCILSITFAYLQYNSFKSNNPAIIFVREVAITSEPNKNSEHIFTLHEGTKVNVLEELNDWMKISIADGQTGWIASENLKLLKVF